MDSEQISNLEAGCSPLPHSDIVCLAHGQGGAEASVDRCPTLTCNHEAPIAAYRAAGACAGDVYAVQAGALRINPTSGPDGVGVQADLCYTLEARAEVQAIAFSCKDHGADAAEELAPTLRAMAHRDSHANAGGQLAVCITGEVVHALRAEGFDASEDGTGRGNPIVAFAQNSRDEVRHMPYVGALSAQSGMKQTSYLMQGMAVRRVTPTECERLQGFPDGWTQVPYRGKPATDGPRYKSLGNSMAVPCMRWLGQRIDAYLKRSARYEKGVRNGRPVRNATRPVSDSHRKSDRNRSLSDTGRCAAKSPATQRSPQKTKERKPQTDD